MKTHFTLMTKTMAAVVLISGVVACTSTSAVDPEQRIATLKRTTVKDADYMKGIAAAVTQEARNDAWAAKKESELQSSYAADKGVPTGALKSVECRRSGPLCTHTRDLE